MKQTNTEFALSLLTVALLGVYGTVQAAEDADLASITKPTSSVSVGIGHLDKDRAQFGIYDGMNDKGSVVLLDANIVKRDDATGTWQTLTVKNMGTDARELRAEYLEQGKQGVTIEYNQLTRNTPYTVNTTLGGIGTEEQVVGTNIATGTLTGNGVQLATEREKLGLGFFKQIDPSLGLQVNFSNETKEGNRHWGRGGAAEFAAEPIDWTTRILEAKLEYAGENLNLSGGYQGSWFENANDLVCTRTASQSCWGAWPSTSSAQPYYLSLPMDNEAHQVFLNGKYKFSPTTTGNFKASYTHATQDEHLPTADIAGLAWAGDATYPAAPSHLNGEVNTTMIQLGLNARPQNKLNVVANLRYHKVDDQTPEALIVNTVSTSGTKQRTLVDTTPLSYETLTGKLEGVYALSDGYQMIAGVDYSSQDRTVPYGSDVAGATTGTTTSGDPEPDGLDDQRYVPWRAKLDELTYRLQLKKSLSETLNGSIAYLHAKRDGSTYTEAAHSEPGEGIHHNAIDPINIADRTRNKWRATVDWSPSDLVSVQFNYEDAKDKYGTHEYGLRDGSARLYSMDTSFTLNDKWTANAWLSHDVTKADQVGWRQGSNNGTTPGNAELDKEAALQDTGNSVGIGLKGVISPKLKVGADLQWTRTTSKIHQEFTVLDSAPSAVTGATTTGTSVYAAGTAAEQLPDIVSKALRIKLTADYALDKQSNVLFDLIHEKWDTNDWTWQFSDGTAFQYGSTTDGTSVSAEPKQNTTFVGVRYRYSFR